ncbi:MAG: hypothetical protein IT385_00230 [Deltaproteobacteria bacterium]|nr:hypothetical protein [Deltaproteobacteria bacterium]
MRVATASFFVSVPCAFAAAACSSSSDGDGDDYYYSEDELGVVIDDFNWADPPKSTNDLGQDQFEEDAEVTLQGRGTHTVLVEYWGEVDDQDNWTGVEILVVTDKTLDQVREYRYDPAMTSFGIGLAWGEDEVEVFKNPDGSYIVDGEPAANGKAAVALLKEHPIYEEASAWGIITAYAVCQSCLERSTSRAPICCVNCSGPNVSEEVAICDVFPDLCACIACDKLDKAECAICP